MAAEDITPQSVFESLSAIRGQIQQRQLEEQQQLAAAEYARQQTLGRLQAQQTEQQPQPAAQPEQSAGPRYLGDEWLAQRDKILKAKEYSYGKMAQANMNSDQYKQVKDYVDSKYDPTGEYSKPWRESPLYKQAQTVANEKDTTSQRHTIDLLKNSVDTIEKIGSPEDTQEEINRKKSSQIKTFLTSLVNSAKGSSDAEQANEVLRRSTEIFSLPEMQALRNKGVLDPTGIMAYLSSKEGNGVIDKIAKSFESDPDAYLQKVKVIHNDLAKSWNERMKERVIYPTNPNTAKELGIAERQLFPMQEQGSNKILNPIGNSQQQSSQVEFSKLSRQQAAAEILRQRAAARIAQPQSQPTKQTIVPQQDFTGKGAF